MKDDYMKLQNLYEDVKKNWQRARDAFREKEDENKQLMDVLAKFSDLA